MDEQKSTIEIAVESLQNVGFTQYQARAYVSLHMAGDEMRVQALSRVSGVPRNKLYDVLASLERGGLVDVTNREPLTVRARALRPVLEARMLRVTRLLDQASHMPREAPPASHIGTTTSPFLSGTPRHV